jgi:hypothetical protein
MRCRNAIKQIGPFIDGELTAPETQVMREHLDACADCSRRYALMHGMVKELSSLPAIVPTPEETYRLMNRLRREMAAPVAPRLASRRGQLAAAALSALVLATVAGVSLAVWSGGGPAPVMEEVTAEGEGVAEAGKEIGQPSEDLAMESMGTGLAAATLARPALVTSGNEYTAADLEDFRNDLGTRLDFYSTYWYPASSGASKPATLKNMQADLTDDLAKQAAAAGQDPGELELAVTAVMEQAGDEPVLPCYAERAKVEGKDAWLISVSGPEDYLLFPDRKQPPAMVLASLGGEESLKVSESVLRELAAWLAPSSSRNVPLVPASTLQSQEAETGSGAPTDGATSTPEGAADAEQGQVQEDFQSFLRQLAAQGTSLDVISALEGLDYEQVLMLMQGNWSSLAAGGVNLSDFLTPPQRLWAVDCASGEVLWSAE